MLEMAMGPEGTGRAANVEGYRVGGKTGTARKQVGRAYAKNKYRASFVGMAPMSEPRVIVAVMIDEPSGGVVLRRNGGGPGVRRRRRRDDATARRAARRVRRAESGRGRLLPRFCRNRKGAVL